MNGKELTGLYERAIDALVKELESFKDEAMIWQVKNGVTNTAGTLSVHLAGSLQHFIGATLGQTGYVRNRDAEFAERGVSRNEIIARLEAAKQMVSEVLPRLQSADMEQPFPFEFAGKQSTGFYLALFIGHMQYHLGQINYLRRMLEA